MAMMQLYFVSHEQDGEDYDLFVWALRPRSVPALWQE